MALTITVELVPAMYAVRLTATGHTGVVSWYRDVSGNQSVYLGDGATILDRAIPLDVSAIYYATDDAATEVADPVTVASPDGRPVLASTMQSVAHPVTVVSYRPYRGQGVSVWHPVIGRSDPLVSIFPALYPAGMLKLRVQDNDERLTIVRDLLTKGDPLYLRSSCMDRLDEMTFLMLDWSDPYTSDEAQGGPAYIEINYQRVTDVPPAWIPAPDRTYQTVLNDHATYQEVLDEYATYQALLDGVPA